MTKMLVGGKLTLLPFQKGMINKSLQLQYENIKTRIGIHYIITIKLNSDVLENVFCIYPWHVINK